MGTLIIKTCQDKWSDNTNTFDANSGKTYVCVSLKVVSLTAKQKFSVA